MDKIKILALVLVLMLTACQEDEHFNKNCMALRISNALPIQFWPTGKESFNEEVVYGVTPICFCQPRECNDEISIQFTDTVEDGEYDIEITDKDGNVLETASAIKAGKTIAPMLQFENPGFTGSIHGWLDVDGSNRSGSQEFSVYISGGEVTGIRAFGTPENTKYLQTYRNIYGWPPGDYTVRVRAKNNSSGAADALGLGVWAMPLIGGGQTTIPSTGGIFPNDNTFYVRDVSFTVISYTAFLAFTFDRLGGGGSFDIDVIMDSLEIVSAPTTYLDWSYTYSFTPSDLGICDEQIIINIKQGALIVASSDCIDVKTSQIGTLLIDYHNATDFDNLSYEDASPTPTFKLRIPAIFYHPTNTKESEDLELSDGRIVRTYTKIEEKKLLEIGFMPHYMHRKLILALSHDFVIIDGLDWLMRDAYEKAEGNRHYPLKTAKVLLTDKSFIKENQL